MKFCLLTSVLSLIVLLKIDAKVQFKITGITCDTSYKTVPEKPVCFIKTFKRQYFVNIRFNVTRKLPNLKADFEILHQNADGFRKVVELKKIDICDEDSKKFGMTPYSNIVKMLLDHVAGSVDGNILAACDYIGELYIKNFTWTNMQVVAFFPPGDYKANLKLYDDLDEQGVAVSILVRRINTN